MPPPQSRPPYATPLDYNPNTKKFIQRKGATSSPLPTLSGMLDASPIYHETQPAPDIRQHFLARLGQQIQDPTAEAFDPTQRAEQNFNQGLRETTGPEPTPDPAQIPLPNEGAGVKGFKQRVPDIMEFLNDLPARPDYGTPPPVTQHTPGGVGSRFKDALIAGLAAVSQSPTSNTNDVLGRFIGAAGGGLVAPQAAHQMRHDVVDMPRYLAERGRKMEEQKLYNDQLGAEGDYAYRRSLAVRGLMPDPKTGADGYKPHVGAATEMGEVPVVTFGEDGMPKLNILGGMKPTIKPDSAGANLRQRQVEFEYKRVKDAEDKARQQYLDARTTEEKAAAARGVFEATKNKVDFHSRMAGIKQNEWEGARQQLPPDDPGDENKHKEYVKAVLQLNAIETQMQEHRAQAEAARSERDAAMQEVQRTGGGVGGVGGQPYVKPGSMSGGNESRYNGGAAQGAAAPSGGGADPNGLIPGKSTVTYQGKTWLYNGMNGGKMKLVPAPPP